MIDPTDVPDKIVIPLSLRDLGSDYQGIKSHIWFEETPHGRDFKLSIDAGRRVSISSQQMVEIGLLCLGVAQQYKVPIDWEAAKSFLDDREIAIPVMP